MWKRRKNQDWKSEKIPSTGCCLFTFRIMSSSAAQNILSIKIVSVDHYLSYPIKSLDVEYSEFRDNVVKFVPVIRVFGTTHNKKKICANIHGAFPYFYVPCAETNNDRIAELMKTLATNIDRSINASFGRSSSDNQHVYRISLVKGMWVEELAVVWLNSQANINYHSSPMYGYHSAEHQFLRIQLYNPNLLRRVSNLLQRWASYILIRMWTTSIFSF